jgi:hypothetical protein
MTEELSWKGDNINDGEDGEASEGAKAVDMIVSGSSFSSNGSNTSTPFFFFISAFLLDTGLD